MSLFSREELKLLIENRQSPSISILMPTHRFLSGAEQDKLLLLNLVKEARGKLAAAGVSVGKARKLLAPVEGFLVDANFWQHQKDGLAIYISDNFFRFYRVALPLSPLVEIDALFHFGPLLPLLAGEGAFYILALSQNDVRLFHGTRLTVDEVHLEDVPKNLAQVIGYDSRLVRRTHFHSTTPGAGGGQETAVFHGWGGYGEEDVKAELLKFSHFINRGIGRLLASERAPLVLACVDYLLPIYREANSYPHLLNEGVAGSPDGLSPQQLHDLAWNVVGPYFANRRQEASRRYDRGQRNGLASSQLLEVIPAAYYGRVDLLFAALDQRQWGTFNPENGEVKLMDQSLPGTDDLVDLASTYTLLNGGDVFAVEAKEFPGQPPLAAVLRY